MAWRSKKSMTRYRATRRAGPATTLVADILLAASTTLRLTGPPAGGLVSR